MRDAKKHMSCYAIRDSKTGLYSTGGACPSWNVVGKRWSRLEHVGHDLIAWRKNGTTKRCREVPKSWEIVEFELFEIMVVPAFALS